MHAVMSRWASHCVVRGQSEHVCGCESATGGHCRARRRRVIERRRLPEENARGQPCRAVGRGRRAFRRHEHRQVGGREPPEARRRSPVRTMQTASAIRWMKRRSVRSAALQRPGKPSLSDQGGNDLSGQHAGLPYDTMVEALDADDLEAIRGAAHGLEVEQCLSRRACGWPITPGASRLPHVPGRQCTSGGAGCAGAAGLSRHRVSN